MRHICLVLALALTLTLTGPAAADSGAGAAGSWQDSLPSIRMVMDAVRSFWDDALDWLRGPAEHSPTPKHLPFPDPNGDGLLEHLPFPDPNGLADGD